MEVIIKDNDKANITFMWDMIEAKFKSLMSPPDEDVHVLFREYEGAVFFGNFKLEFWKTNTVPCCSCFQYGADDKTEFSPYSWLDNGVPYEEREEDIAEKILIVKRRTFEAFAKNIESQIINVLNLHPKYIEEAIVSTEPEKWYPYRRYYEDSDITRIA